MMEVLNNRGIEIIRLQDPSCVQRVLLPTLLVIVFNPLFCIYAFLSCKVIGQDICQEPEDLALISSTRPFSPRFLANVLPDHFTTRLYIV